MKPRRRPLPRLALSLIIGLALTYPLLAIAQEAAAPPPVEAISPRGYLLTGLATLAGLAFTSLMAAGALAVAQKSKDGAAWALVNRLYNAAQTAAAHVGSEMSPAIKAALADGKITPEEAAELKARAIEVLKLVAGEQLAQVHKTLGIPPEAMPAFLSGLIEKAVVSLKVKPSSSRPSVVNVANGAPRE